eukprot:293510_1
MLKKKTTRHSSQKSKFFIILGYKLPRLFVFIMCMLIIVILILIFEISLSHTSTINKQETDHSSYMKNKITVETAPINLIPVLILCHARPKYLQRTLKSVFTQLNKNNWNETFTIFISQDGNDNKISQIIKSYAIKRKAYWLKFDYSLTNRKMMKGFEQESWRVYHKISAHYKWALNKILIELNYKKLIILEEDMDISTDFFSYFYNLSPLLDIDKSIYCISAWNDYGQNNLVNNPYSLHRTDVFPGLGWMLTQDLWNEFRYNFSLAFWDDWFREPKQTKNRSCIRPEISRTHTFGQFGSSGGWFYEQYLKKMRLNMESIDWSKQNVTYLLNINYDMYLKNMIKNSKVISYKELNPSNMRRIENDIDCVVYYKDLNDYSIMSKSLTLMQDHKFGLPRQSYRGIVIVYWYGHKILFVPKNLEWTPRNKYEFNVELLTQFQSHYGTEKSVLNNVWDFFG